MDALGLDRHKCSSYSATVQKIKAESTTWWCVSERGIHDATTTNLQPFASLKSYKILVPVSIYIALLIK